MIDAVAFPPVRAFRMGECRAELERRADGTLLVRNPAELGPYPQKITERLEHWAKAAPDRVWLAAREGGGWRRITYGGALASVRRIAGALISRGLSAERPLVILSGNDLDHALLGMGALYAGVAYAPVSPAYSLVSSDHGKLKYIMELLTPGLVFAADGAQFAKAIAGAVPADIELVTARNAPPGRPSTDLAALLDSPDTPAVDAAHEAVGPDTIAKFLFTSGSTGMPKGVINTQRMLCANAEMASAHFAFMRDEPPVTLDWSPWNHTAGGNHNFNLLLYHGGTYYLDDGKPVPGAIEATVRNLREVSPTWYFNVPKGFAALAPYLRADPALCGTFFEKLNMLWYAGAGMARHLWDELDALSVRTRGERVIILTGLGSTETAPFALAANQTMEGAGNIGVPARGTMMKLVPSEGKWEARLRGPHITPGYWRQPELTAKAFDEEGFYKLGDAVRFADESDAGKGFFFDGRTAEDFKLNTGTWVAVGPLRAAFIDHFAPYIHDAVIAGLNEDYLGILAFPDMDACRKLAGAGPETPAREVLANPALRAEMRALLASLAAKSTGSSTRVQRLILLEDGPSIDKGEMTDKGSINQRAVLGARAHLAAALYAEPAADFVLSAK